jgi:hypothetical protein
MKYKISNERFRKFLFNLLNKELEKGKFHSWIESYGYSNIGVDDEYNGLMVVADDEEIKIYPALYKTIMTYLGMDRYQIEDFLTMWATMELPKKVPLGKKYFTSDKFVDVIY